MSGVNKVILMGRLGQDPETKHLNDTSVTNFSVATSETWKGKDGEKQEKTEWSRCVAWGKTGEFIQKYFSKGNMIFLEGKMETRNWEDKDGNKRYTTEVKVFKAEFTGESAGSGGGDGASKGGGNDGPPPSFGGGGADSGADIPF